MNKKPKYSSSSRPETELSLISLEKKDNELNSKSSTGFGKTVDAKVYQKIQH